MQSRYRNAIPTPKEWLCSRPSNNWLALLSQVDSPLFHVPFVLCSIISLFRCQDMQTSRVRRSKSLNPGSWRLGTHQCHRRRGTTGFLSYPTISPPSIRLSPGTKTVNQKHGRSFVLKSSANSQMPTSIRNIPTTSVPYTSRMSLHSVQVNWRHRRRP